MTMGGRAFLPLYSPCSSHNDLLGEPLLKALLASDLTQESHSSPQQGSMGPRDQHLPLSPWLCSTTLPCLIPQTCPTCPHLSIFLLVGPSAQTASLARCWCVTLFSLLKLQLEYSLFRPHRTSIPDPPQQSLCTVDRF